MFQHTGKILSNKITRDEIETMIGILGLHFMMTQSLVVATTLTEKEEVMENDLARSMALGRTLVQEIIAAAQGDEEVLGAIKIARIYFGTPAEWEEKRAAARTAYHQRELVKQPS